MKRGRITGVVFDSVASRPLAGALVYLSGTRYSTTADSSGSFAFDVPEGRHFLSFHDKRMDELPRFDNVRAIDVVADSVLTLELTVPSASSLTAAHCSLEERAATARAIGMHGKPLAIITGAVREGGRNVAGARVELEWAGRFANVSWVETNARGEYAICGYPATSSGTLRVVQDGEVRQLRSFNASKVLVRRIDFELPRL